AANSPTVLDYAVDLGGTYCHLGHLKFRTSQFEATLELYAQAIHTLTAVLAKDQRLATAREFLRYAHLGRADALTRLGRYAEAIQDCDRAVAEADSLAQGKDAGPTLYDAACVYAKASAALKDNRERAERHALKAIVLLDRAQAAGYFREPKIAHMK